MVYLGFDNGVSSRGIGIIYPDKPAKVLKLPIFNEASYTKKEKHINRINTPELRKILLSELVGMSTRDVLCGLERPMINSARFAASMSAIRALEATLIVLEDIGLNYIYMDSKEWQVCMLPTGTKGTDELKAASLEVGNKLFPHLIGLLKKDADGLLLAEYMRRKAAKQLI